MRSIENSPKYPQKGPFRQEKTVLLALGRRIAKTGPREQFLPTGKVSGYPQEFGFVLQILMNDFLRYIHHRISQTTANAARA